MSFAARARSSRTHGRSWVAFVSENVFDDESVASRFWALYRNLSAAVVGALLAAKNDFDGSQMGRKVV